MRLIVLLSILTIILLVGIHTIPAGWSQTISVTPVTSQALKVVDEPTTLLTVSEDYKHVEYDPAKVTVKPFGTDVGYYLAGELRLEAYCQETVPFFRVICPDGTEIVTRALALYSNDGQYQGDVLVLVPEKEKP